MRFSHLLISAALATSAVAFTIPSSAGSAHRADTSKSSDEKYEKTVPLKDIPAPARATAMREAKGGKLVKVEEMSKSGETVYEAVILKGSDETGVVINAKGKVLERHAEKSEKKK